MGRSHCRPAPQRQQGASLSWLPSRLPGDLYRPPSVPGCRGVAPRRAAWSKLPCARPGSSAFAMAFNGFGQRHCWRENSRLAMDDWPLVWMVLCLSVSVTSHKGAELDDLENLKQLHACVRSQAESDNTGATSTEAQRGLVLQSGQSSCVRVPRAPGSATGRGLVNHAS